MTFFFYSDPVPVDKSEQKERGRERGRKVLVPEGPPMSSSVFILNQIARRSNRQPLKP